MRLGCIGCLLLIILILVIALGVIFLAGNILATPDVQPVSFARSDGLAAQQRLFEVLLRQSGQSRRRDPIVITEAEANAFLAKHLDQAGLPLSPIVVRFSRGELTAQGQTALRNLFKGPIFSHLLPYVPDKRLDTPVWVTVRARIRVDATDRRHYGNVEVGEFALGRQPLGSFLLSFLMGPTGGGLLKWPIPSVVDDIQIRDRQVVISTR